MKALLLVMALASARGLMSCSDERVGLFGGRVDISTAGYTSDVRATDLDADELPDLFALNFDNASAAIFRNVSNVSGTLSFEQGATVPVGDRPVAVVVGDLNSDSRPDVVVVNRDSNTATILINDTSSGGDVLFVTSEFPTGTRPVAAALGDVNGDKAIDIVIASQGQQGPGESR